MRQRVMGPVDQRGLYAAMLIGMLFAMLVLWCETEYVAYRDQFRSSDLGTPLAEHIYAPWASWYWMQQDDMHINVAALFFGRGSWYTQNPAEPQWARDVFRGERARAPYELGFILFIVVCLSVALRRIVPTSMSHGSARWATAADVTRSPLAQSSNGVVLGGNPYSPRSLLVYGGEGNVIVLGTPGTGKSNGVVAPTLLRTWPGSAIVFDPSGELAARTAHRRENVFIFDPRSAKSARYNPFATVEPSNIDEIQTILASYFLERDPSEMSDNASYFIFSALELGVALVARAMERDRENHHVNGGLSSAAAYYYGSAFQTDQAFVESFRLSNIPYVVDTGSKFEKMHEEQRSSVIGTLTRYLAVFRSDDVARVTSASDFSIADLRKRSTTLYVTVRERDMAALTPVMRMVLTRLFDDLTVAVPKPDEQSVMLLLDEFPLLRAPVIKQKLATFRKYRVHPVLLAQTITQIVEYYGVNEPISGLCDVRAYFPVLDEQTQQHASQTCGVMTQWAENTSTGQERTNRSYHEVGRPLLLPSELAGLGKGVIVAVKGHPPVRGLTIVSHQDARFTTPSARAQAERRILKWVICGAGALVLSFCVTVFFFQHFHILKQEYKQSGKLHVHRRIR